VAPTGVRLTREKRLALANCNGLLVRASDELVATVTAREKREQEHIIVFDCTVRAADRELANGSVTVTAPTSHLSYTELITPQVVIRRNDAFAPSSRTQSRSIRRAERRK